MSEVHNTLVPYIRASFGRGEFTLIRINDNPVSLIFIIYGMTLKSLTTKMLLGLFLLSIGREILSNS